MITKVDQHTITQKITEEYGKYLQISVVIIEDKIKSIIIDSTPMPPRYLNMEDHGLIFLLFFYHPKEMQDLIKEIEVYCKNEKHT
jgi:hypothetical protein